MGLQDLVVALVVLGAVAWLTRRWWRRRKRGACTCDGCPVAEQVEAQMRSMPKPPGLLTIDDAGPKRS